MRTNARFGNWKIAVPLLAALAMAVLPGGTSPDCGGGSSDGPADLAGTPDAYVATDVPAGQDAPMPEDVAAKPDMGIGNGCKVPADCETLAHPSCDGQWVCKYATCGWECSVPPAGCHSDAECPKGQHCTVSDGACDADPTCPTCAVCAGTCVDDVVATCVQSGCSGEVCGKEAVGSDCLWLDWYECLALTECGPFGEGGACAFLSTPKFEICVAERSGCTSHNDCPEGYLCTFPDCASGADCPGAKGTCYKKEAPVGCLSDAECPEGFYCERGPDCQDPIIDPATGIPVPPCEKGSCLPGTQPVKCYGDSDCPKGQTCDFTKQCMPCEPCTCENGGTDCVCPPCPSCVMAAWGYCTDACTDLDGDGACAADDCDDQDPAVSPWAVEACEDGLDNDCDGYVDEDCVGPLKCFSDADCPKGEVCWYGKCPPCTCDPADPTCVCPACILPQYGYCGPAACVDMDGDGWCAEDGDCNDQDPAVNPGMPEICDDGLDNDCDGLTDEDCTGPVKCFSDADCPVGEVCWYGKCPPCMCDPADPTCFCPACVMAMYGYCGPASCTDLDGDGWCAEGGDCNDQDPAVNPAAPELCDDGVDNDCDGLADEDCLAPGQCWTDADCKPGDYCAVMKCSGLRCVGPYQCEPLPQTGCAADSDCAAGEFCDFSAVDATTCCLPGEPCLDIFKACQGTCRLEPGLCWDASDCKPGELCEGAIVCPEGAYCFVADQPGKCVLPVEPVCAVLASGSHGACKQFLGWIWDGKQCVAEGGCSCGADCASFFATKAECEAACIPVEPPCPKVATGTHGLCDMILGVVFDGTSCVYESGCSCGADCGAFYKTMEDCQAACLPPSTPVACTADADCAWGELCISVVSCPACVYADPPCKVACQVSQTCRTPCKADADCGKGETCKVPMCGADPCPGPYGCFPAA